ncbi:sigma-70 family RNA polymerase sigma factor [Vibrio parahaemolyticus]
MSDRDLCERVFNNDEGAFDELKKKHSGLVFTICKEKLEAGGLHKQLSIDYNELLEELSLVIWQELYSEIKKGITFTNEKVFIYLLRDRAKWRAVDYIRSSIKRRTQGSVGGKNNTFPRISNVPEDELSLLGSPEALIGTEEEAEKFYPMLLSQLDEKELAVISVMRQLAYECGDNMKKIKQKDIAEHLDLNVRIVRDRMKSIKIKALKIKLELFTD